mgnify:CR=1 FL=1|jgi:hypothetical protein|tara:strand:+ start:122 stop:412 length:291 start_codon:yes stop_codon:yes gene_type:complete
MAKTTKDVTKEILDVDFEDTSKAKMLDDDGYEEGKSKEREMIADASGKNVKDITSMLELKKMQESGGNIRKNKNLLNKKISDTMTKKQFTDYIKRK